MAKQRSLFGELSYAAPVSTYVGTINAPVAVKQMDAPLKELDSIDPLGLNTLNADRNVSSNFANKQNEYIESLNNPEDIYSAASKAKRKAKEFALQAKDVNRVEGAASKNLALRNDYRDKENTNNKINKDVSSFLQRKSEHIYNKNGGVGQANAEGRSINPQGFNSFNGIRTAETVDEAALLKSAQEGFEKQLLSYKTPGRKDGEGRIVQGDGKYLYNTKSEREFVDRGNVENYVNTALLSNTEWVSYKSQVLEKGLFNEALQSMSEEQAFDYLDSPEGKQVLQNRVKQYAAQLAKVSGDKKQVNRVKEEQTRTESKSWGASQASLNQYNNKKIDVLREGRLVVNKSINNSKALNESLGAASSEGLKETELLFLGTEGNEGLFSKLGMTSDEFLRKTHIFWEEEDVDREVEKLLATKDYKKDPEEDEEKFSKRMRELAEDKLSVKAKSSNKPWATLFLDSPEVQSYFQQMPLTEYEKENNISPLDKLRRISEKEQTLIKIKENSEAVARQSPFYDEVLKAEKEYNEVVGGQVNAETFNTGDTFINELLAPIYENEEYSKSQKEQAKAYITNYKRFTGKDPESVLAGNSFYYKEQIGKTEEGKQWLEELERVTEGLDNVRSSTEQVQKLRSDYLTKISENLEFASVSSVLGAPLSFNTVSERYESTKEGAKVALDLTKEANKIFNNSAGLQSFTGSIEIKDEDGEVTSTEDKNIGDIFADEKEANGGKDPEMSDLMFSDDPSIDGEFYMYKNIGNVKVKIPIKNQVPGLDNYLKSIQTPRKEVVSKLIKDDLLDIAFIDYARTPSKEEKNSGDYYEDIRVEYPSKAEDKGISSRKERGASYDTFYNDTPIKLHLKKSGEKQVTLRGREAVNFLEKLKKDGKLKF